MELAQEWFSYVTRNARRRPSAGAYDFPRAVSVVVGAHVDGRQRKEE
jgi:hypothetical protein